MFALQIAISVLTVVASILAVILMFVTSKREKLQERKRREELEEQRREIEKRFESIGEEIHGVSIDGVSLT